MGTTAQIHPFPLLVDGDFLRVGEVFNDLHLEVLSHISEDFDRFFPGANDTFHRHIVSNDFFHALLNALEILRREVVTGGKIVIETIFDGWPNRHLSTGE